MKINKQRTPNKPSLKPVASPVQTEKAPARQGVPWWAYAIGLFAALFLTLEIYQPALKAPFLFDDLYLPFMDPTFPAERWRAWITGVRPLLMFTYWLNYQSAGLNPLPYHVWNLLFHLGASAMVWLIARNLLGKVGEEGWRKEILAVFAGLVFLTHPLQTESVAYVASRSEAFSVLFAYAAVSLYLARNGVGISWGRAALVLLFTGAAALSKEHTAVIPAVLLLIDLYWNDGSFLQTVKRNWRLYVPAAIAGLFGAAFVWNVLRTSTSAGFAMKDLPWTSYFFTQCRAIWVYLRLVILPYGQNIDHDFTTSHSLFDHGAFVGLAGLIALVALAWYLRRRAPLASFGIVIFLLLIAPTSSVVPIKDTLVERRVYLPFLGLLLVAVDVLRRWKPGKLQLTGALGAIIALLCVLTYSRNLVWGGPISLWQDTADKSHRKSRPRFQLAFALYTSNRCGEAAKEYEKAAAIEPPDSTLLVNWALAHQCSQQYGPAIEKLELALEKEKTAHVYSLIGMIRAQQGLTKEAWDALNEAVRVDGNYPMSYVYRGNLNVVAGDLAAAQAEYRKALAIDPKLPAAQEALARLEFEMRSAPAKKQP